MPRARRSPIRACAIVGALVLGGSLAIIDRTNAQEAAAGGVREAAERSAADGELSAVRLPGGLRAALAVLRDYNPPDRSQFLLELIRRVHHPATEPDGPREASLVALLAHLDAMSAAESRAVGVPDGARAEGDTLPLPFTPQVWIDVVLGGRATPQTLVAEILRSRGAALLYYGLLSLDADTRTWLAGEPALLREIVARYGPAFTLVAPNLRVSARRILVPGGEPAIGGWEALTGRRVSEPAEFIRALLLADEGRLAWFFGALAPLTPGQLRVALDLDAGEASAHAAATRRLYDAFVRTAGDWRVDSRTFWRPPLDPALLLAALPVDAQGAAILPATRRFWTAVFNGDASPDAARLLGGDRLDFPWLCERVFDGEPSDHRRRAHQVLFASRLASQPTAATVVDAVAAVRTAARAPALVGILERLGVTDVAIVARAGRRAAELTALGADDRALRGLAQFQGLLALMGRAAARGSISPAVASELTASLVAVDLGKQGDYEGRLVSWLVDHLDAFAPARPASPPMSSGQASADLTSGAEADAGRLGEVERAFVLALAGRSAAPTPVIEWEGTRYRIDLAHAEIVRIERLLGDAPKPWLTAARTLVSLAESLGAAPLTAANRTRVATTLTGIAGRFAWDRHGDELDDRVDDTRKRFADVAAQFGVTLPERSAPNRATPGRAGSDRAASPRSGPDRAASDRVKAPAAATALRVLADDLFARGLIELTYAASLGQPDRAWIAAGDAAHAHDFGLRAPGGRRPDVPWRRPIAGADARREWRATGSLLGLDVSLAELSLVRLSTRPPPRRPSLNEEDRRVLIESVSLIEPAKLTDADLERLVSAMERGRTRLRTVRGAADAAALARDLRLSPARSTLLAWTLAHDPARITSFLSPLELFWLGLDGHPIDPSLHAWGAPAEAVDGCLCLRVVDRQPWETRAGRWGSGAFAGAFPDLNLRVGELLMALQMPAALAGPVLASATLDLVNLTASRGPDDRRSLVEFVQALTPERMEQYLALLTTDGPLVPLEEAPDLTGPGSGTANGKPGTPR